MNKRHFFPLTAIVTIGFLILFSSFRDNDRVDRTGLDQLKKGTEASIQPEKPSFLVDRNKTVANKDYLNPVIAPHKGGLLRGINLGMERNEVKSLEQSTLIAEQDLKLVYQITPADINMTVQVTYDFSYEGKLNLITVDVFADKDEDVALVKKAYEAYFNNVMGPYQLDTSGYMNWQIQSPLPYSVFLKEVSMPGDAGLTLQFVGL